MTFLELYLFQLGSTYDGSSSVVIGDVDCTVHSDLCQKYGVRGYPTVKYFTTETGQDGADYQGGRDIASLKKFTADTLEVRLKQGETVYC